MRTSGYLSRAWLIFFLSIAIILITAQACRKMDKPKEQTADLLRERFFAIQPNTHPLVAAIAASIKRQDVKRDLVPGVVRKAGMPVWDKAKISSSSISARNGEGDQVFIPFVMEDEQRTKAILSVKLEGEDTLYSMVYGTRYHQYGFDSSGNDGRWSAPELFTAFALFDNDIYGHDEFYINDSRLLGTSTDTFGSYSGNVKIENIDPQLSGRLQNPSGTILVLVTFMICVNDPGGRASSAEASAKAARFPVPCYNVSYFSETVVFNLDENYPSGGYYEGGGGGGSPIFCPGCNWEDTNPCEEQDPMMPQEPCDEGWQPTLNAQPEPFDPYRYDSVKVSSEIEDSFPCIYQLLKEDLYDVNKLTQIGMHDIFTVNQYNHTYFQLDYSLCGTGISGAAHDQPTRIVLNGQQHFIDTISLNPCWLKQASRESIVATIVHETIHAYILWCFADYQRYQGYQQGWTIDSNYLRDNFSIYWAKYKNRPWDASFQHQVIADNYLTYIASVIYTWGNNNAPTALRQWVAKQLAAGGLQSTSAWGSATGLTDTCTINQVLYWGKKFHDAPGTSIGYTGGTPCRQTDFSFRDSLQMIRGDSCQ
jgi:hypothetical protein